ncbi:hypothetical protein AnigIFM60653_001761 [Aspergillus niger]|nr:hypothetical protein AnigIFM60653_001761 [Aspergillus niger]GLA17543.1 hypothetical protein AnigIFM62618_004683 [Aspergillus niger]
MLDSLASAQKVLGDTANFIQPATSARRLALELSAVMENSRNVAPMESIAIAAKIDYLLVLSE